MDMLENTATLEIPVTEEYKPNVYVTATLIRSTRSLEKHAPSRAFGTVPLVVTCEDHRLFVALDVPAEMRPKRPLQVGIQVSGNLRDAFVTLAAVDEGICQLTDFKTPDAFALFYAKKRLQVRSYDFYATLLPELDISETQSSTSGDRLEGVRKKHLMPVDVKRIKPVSLWSGIVHLGKNGKGTVSLEVPEFNGSLRLMAVSFDGANFGSATQHVTVRDHLVLTATFPRFLAPHDTFRVPISLSNGCGVDGTFSVSLGSRGPVEIVGEKIQSVQIADGEERIVFFRVKASTGMGKVSFEVSAQGAGESTQTHVELPLRPAAPRLIKTGSGVITEDQPVTLELPSDWIPGTEEVRLTTSAFPAIRFSESLQYLLRYPHGCIEQTTSRVFPLLYFDELARLADPELFKANPAEYYVEEGIAKLEAMQLSSGLFSFWPNSTRHSAWGSIYAAHFLVEAQKAGYSVSGRVHRTMLKGLREFVRSREHRDDPAAQVYALYVLAAAEKPERSSMIYLKDDKITSMSLATRFQLAGAFGLSGDRRTAESLLPIQIQPQTVPREMGGMFRSSVRENAIILDVLSEIAPHNASVPVLVKSLTDAAKSGRWDTTQENAFAFLALGKVLKRKGADAFVGKVTLNGEEYAQFDTKNKVMADRALGGKEIGLHIEGEGTCYYYWQVGGIPRGFQIEEYDKGLQVRREYLDRDGNALNLEQVKQGDLVVAKITMKALDKALENVVVADLLPAGFEIENPRLESRADVPWIEEQQWSTDYMDIRDDRMLLFLNLPGPPRKPGLGRLSGTEERTFYYALRAVTVGEFTLPPITAECMYDPSYTSVASSGVITVVGME
ncbi:MAG: alpha-2-macroglobulin family protein [Candidatus Latescibacterota bacterium]